MTDAVNHPDHYAKCSLAVIYEPADLTVRMSHPIGAAIEYLLRAGLKEGVSKREDYEKALWWLERVQPDVGMEPYIREDDDKPHFPVFTGFAFARDFVGEELFKRFAFGCGNGIVRELYYSMREGLIWPAGFEYAIKCLRSELDDLK